MWAHPSTGGTSLGPDRLPSSAPSPARRWNVGVMACLVALLSVLVGGPAMAATTPERVTWAVQHEVAEGQQQRVSFRYELEPGGTVTDSVTVTNFTAEPVEFKLYASDGVITADGQFDLLPAAEKPKDVGSWITMSESSVTVPGSSSASVPFTVTVPANATPGDHPGGIVAALTRAGADGGQQVSVENRVGARVHLRVGGELKPVLTVSNVNVDYHGNWNPLKPGTADVSYKLENTGNVRLGTDQKVVMRGLFGIPLTEKSSQKIAELLPGSSITVQEKVNGVWPLFRARAGIEGTPFAVGSDVVDATMTVVPASGGAWAMPWAILAAAALIVILVYLFVIRRRRGKEKLEAALEKARKEGAAQAAGVTKDAEKPKTDGSGSDSGSGSGA